MARFGKLPVKVPTGVTVTIDANKVMVKGPKGSIEREFPTIVSVTQNEGQVLVTTTHSSKAALAIQGTVKAHITNMIHGVHEGFTRELEIVGAGYRGEVRGQDLVMQIGYSHPVTITAPQGVTFKVDKSIITVSGSNKEDVGHISSLVRGSRPPEPYKGTGIKYTDEVIRRKAGKQAAK